MPPRISLKTSSDLARMREAGRITAEILGELQKAVAPGVTTGQLDALAEELTYRKKARPAFKGYQGFPGCLCASLNDEVVHGIPSASRALKAGDVLKLDFGVVYRGFYGDSAVSVTVGKASPEALGLIQATREALLQGIAQMLPGRRVSDIGGAVEARAGEGGFAVVQTFVGHGIGRSLHEAPSVPNYRSPEGWDPVLKAGMVLAVEPMLNLGTPEVAVLDDDWTAVTADGQLSAHFEHTVAVTDEGPVILTLP